MVTRLSKNLYKYYLKLQPVDCIAWLRLSINFRLLVGWFTPPLPWDGGTARTAIQVYAVNLIELG